MQVIAAEGKGVVLYLRREEHGVDLFTGNDGQTQSSTEPSTNRRPDCATSVTMASGPDPA